MRLIKLNTEHFIIVDDSEIKEGDWYYHPNNSVNQYGEREIEFMGYDEKKTCKKITHSTQPLEHLTIPGTYNGPVWNKVKQIYLQEVKKLIEKLIDEMSVEYKAIQFMNSFQTFSDNYNTGMKFGYERGYNQAIEDNKEKKYTEEDIKRATKMSFDGSTFKEIIQSLQPKTEWEVEFVDNKLKLK